MPPHLRPRITRSAGLRGVSGTDKSSDDQDPQSTDVQTPTGDGAKAPAVSGADTSSIRGNIGSLWKGAVNSISNYGLGIAQADLMHSFGSPGVQYFFPEITKQQERLYVELSEAAVQQMPKTTSEKFAYYAVQVALSAGEAYAFARQMHQEEPAEPLVPAAPAKPRIPPQLKAGVVNNEILEGEFAKLGIPTATGKAVRDASGKTMRPRRYLDPSPIDASGAVHPIELGLPGTQGSAQKNLQYRRDVAHAQQSPVRQVKKDEVSHPFGSEWDYIFGYAIKTFRPPMSN